MQRAREDHEDRAGRAEPRAGEERELGVAEAHAAPPAKLLVEDERQVGERQADDDAGERADEPDAAPRRGGEGEHGATERQLVGQDHVLDVDRGGRHQRDRERRVHREVEESAFDARVGDARDEVSEPRTDGDAERDHGDVAERARAAFDEVRDVIAARQRVGEARCDEPEEPAGHRADAAHASGRDVVEECAHARARTILRGCRHQGRIHNVRM